MSWDRFWKSLQLKPRTSVRRSLDIRTAHNYMVIEPIGYASTDVRSPRCHILALADPTRRAILARLARSEASVREIAAPFAISQPAISKHLEMLERAGP